MTLTTWARAGQYAGVTYDHLGLPASRSYPGTGPANVTFTYDRRNRLSGVGEAGGTRTLYYNDAGQLTGSYQTGGTLSGYALTNQYDALLRKSYVSVRAPSGIWYAASTYGYDNASRLSAVSFGGSTITYGYLANSPTSRVKTGDGAMIDIDDG